MHVKYYMKRYTANRDLQQKHKKNYLQIYDQKLISSKTNF